MNIITLDILKQCGVCDAAYVWTANTFDKEFKDNGHISYEYGHKKLIEYVKENPETTEKWLEWYEHLPKRKTYLRLMQKVEAL